MASCRREPKTSLADARPGAPDDRLGAGPGAPAHRSTANGSDARLGAAFVQHFAPAGEGDLQGARRIRLRTAAAGETDANVSRCALARNTRSKGPPRGRRAPRPRTRPRTRRGRAEVALLRDDVAAAADRIFGMRDAGEGQGEGEGECESESEKGDECAIGEGSRKAPIDVRRTELALRRFAAPSPCDDLQRRADRAGLSRDRRAPLLPHSRAGIGSVARRPSAAPSP